MNDQRSLFPQKERSLSVSSQFKPVHLQFILIAPFILMLVLLLFDHFFPNHEISTKKFLILYVPLEIIRIGICANGIFIRLITRRYNSDLQSFLIALSFLTAAIFFTFRMVENVVTLTEIAEASNRIIYLRTAADWIVTIFLFAASFIPERKTVHYLNTTVVVATAVSLAAAFLLYMFGEKLPVLYTPAGNTRLSSYLNYSSIALCFVTALRYGRIAVRKNDLSMFFISLSMVTLMVALEAYNMADTLNDIFRIIGNFLAAFSFIFISFAIVNRSILVPYKDLTFTREKLLSINKELHKNQRRMIESERKYRQLIETANSVILRCDPSGTIIFMNEYGLKFFGYSKEEIIGKSVKILIPDIESSGRDLSRLMDEIIADPKRHIINVNENLRKDGSRVWLSWSNRPIDDESGRTMEILSIGVDITEQKKTEEALRRSNSTLDTFFESSPSIINLLDKDLRYVNVDMLTPTYYGLSRKELIGKAVSEFVRLPGKFGEMMRRVLDTGEPISNYEIIGIPPPKHHKETAYWRLSLFPVPMLDGSRGVGIMGIEITDIKKAENALKENRNKLNILNENLENMVVRRTEQVRELAKALTLAEQQERRRISLVLHEDLLQILFSATLRIDLASKAESLEDALEDISEAKRLTRKAVDTANAVSLELNPPVLKSEGLDTGLKWLAQYFSTSYGLHVSINIPESFRDIKEEERTLLVQFVRELFTNIVRHANTNSADLIAYRRDGTVDITVSDKGKGFDIEVMRSMRRTEKYFGLFGIEERVKLIGGNVDIESKPGEGTRVKISFPVPSSG